MVIERAGIVLAALVVGIGCGSADGGAKPGAATTREAPSVDRRTVVLTLRHHGRTVRLRRATRITLVLGGRYRWSDPVSAGAVVANAVESDAPTAFQVWELRAKRTGKARVRSTGSPACRPTTAGCPKTARRFVVTLDVRA